MTTSDLKPNEFAKFYSGYINKASGYELIDGLIRSSQETKSFFSAIPEHKQEFAYAEGKWTPKEILVHLMDSERIFAYRALRFARKDKTPLPGFDENDYAKYSKGNSFAMEKLIKSYDLLRHSTIDLFSDFSHDTLLELGMASNATMSVRALGFVIIGHEKHHCNIISERYL